MYFMLGVHFACSQRLTLLYEIIRIGTEV
jgi:hypothetical protein